MSISRPFKLLPILAAWVSASSLAAPVITSGTGTITPDANGGFIVDCPIVCTLAPNVSNTSFTGNVIINSGGQITLPASITVSTATYSGIATTTGMISGDVVSGTQSTSGAVGGLIGSNSGSVTSTGTINNIGGTLVANSGGNLSGNVNYSLSSNGSVPTTITIADYPATVGSTATVGGTVGGLTGSNNGNITNTGIIGTNGGTLVVNSIFSNNADAVTITPSGTLTILDGGAVTLTGEIFTNIQIGLNGPMLIPANISSDARTFSDWLKGSGLVTTQQTNSVRSLIGSGLNFVLFGSHHRILLDNGMEKDGTGVWATGDYLRHDPDQINASVGEFGVYHDSGRFRVGIGAGTSQAKQTLPVYGNGRLDSRYLILETDYRFASADWVASATLFLGTNKADIARGYLIGVTPDLSTGKANGSSRAIRFRSDWSDTSSIFGMSFSPYLAYTHAETLLDAYTETGGTLPLSFSEQKQSSNELRAGATLLRKLSEATDLRFPMELAYRKNSASAISGSTLGLPFTFNNAGTSLSWGRVGIEVDHRLSEHAVLNGATIFSSNGGDSSGLATAGFRYAF